MAVMLFALLAVPRLAFAKPCDEIHTWFYSDESCTEEVGGMVRDCDGKVHSWGTVTSHYDQIRDCCWNQGCWNGGYGCEGLPSYSSSGCYATAH